MSDYDVTTVGGVSNFPIKDITHKPKRQQDDMIKMRRREEGIVDTSPDSVEETEETLKVITLERAISYYKRKSADPVNGNLYEATAKWLEELLVNRTNRKTPKVEDSPVSDKKETPENGNENTEA